MIRKVPMTCCLLVGLVGCGQGVEPAPFQPDSPPGGDSAGPGSGDGPGVVAGQGGDGDGDGVTVDFEDVPGADNSTEDNSPPAGKDDKTGGRVSLGSGGLPCDVQDVLTSSCQGCHGSDPGAQSPMALTSHADLMAPGISQPDKAVYELVGQRVHMTGAGQMPPPGRGRPLTESEMAVLDSWIEAGAPEGQCVEEPVDPLTGITYEAPAEDEIEACYKFYAHQNSVPGDTTPFLARTGEYYTAYYFDVPWEGEKQAITFRSSDTSITHHWLLYDTPEPLADGTVLDNTTGSHVGAPDLLAAWAINQQRVQHMPKEAGLAMPVRGTGRRFLLEVHYFNPDAPQPDSSGVEVCIGKQPRPNTATVSWLGTEAIALFPGQAADIFGTCTPQYQEDIFIFRSFPHMHEQGYHLTTEIRRTDGSMETLVDKPFDFNNQLMYDTPAVIHPGDQLITTCKYQNMTDRLIGVGYDSLSEMCFNFVYAWPAKALIGGISLTGTSTPCLL